MRRKLTNQEQQAKWIRISKAKKAKAALKREVEQPPTGPRYPVTKIK